MPDQYLTPHQAALQVGVSVHTIRRWCGDHAAYLSPSASPASGATRRLSAKDVEVLQEVARLRNTEGLTTTQINERLAGVVFPEATAIEPAPPSPQPALMPVVVVEALARMEERLQAIETQRQRVDVVFIAVAAFVAGLIIGLAVWWFQ